MNFQIAHVNHLAYVLLLALAALVSGNVLLLALRRRHAPGAREMAVFSLALTIWAGTYALHWLDIWQPYPHFWLDVTYLGVVLVPPGFLAFALAYTDHGEQINQRSVTLLSIMPLLTLVILFTDPWHGLFFGGQRTISSNAILQGGIWFWVNVSYSYILMWLAFILLIQAFLRSAPHYRPQLGIVILGAMAPFALNALVLGGAFPHTDLDLTPFAFSISGLAFGYALLRHRWLELSPVARSTLVDSMSDGMLVVDNHNRVVDINPAAQRILNLGDGPFIGRPVVDVLDEWHDFIIEYRDAQFKHQELQLDDQPPRWIELRVSALIDRQGRLRGRLAAIRDISERKRFEAELHAANQALHERLEEIEALQALLREQAIRDSLTGLYNRRYLDENLTDTLINARNYQQPVSLAIIDLDWFKQFNDHNGHEAGDYLLKLLGELLQANTRSGDLACRYGGEEFLLVLPATPGAVAVRRVDEMRLAFAARTLEYQGQRLRASFSAGVAAYPDHTANPNDLLNLADRALYTAKGAGRNQVRTP